MSTNPLVAQHTDSEAILHLREAINSGANWYVALLEAIGLWCSAAESWNGRHYSYLIAGQAFDWLSLAERLCVEVDGLIPEDEKMNLLFWASPPVELSQKEFHHLIGEVKYRAYLNYLYGIVVEEALLAAVEEEVSKERGCFAVCDHEEAEAEAYRRIYGADLQTLLRSFQEATGQAEGSHLTLNQYNEFTYWLFGYRVSLSEKARVASDTKKALDWLRGQWAAAAAKKGNPVASARYLPRA
ncbi:MAG: hypothetical protein FJ020_09775 [Chloroflexi bacterium]|nr:hypothetical protein [Chloroflexota bacterium]